MLRNTSWFFPLALVLAGACAHQAQHQHEPSAHAQPAAAHNADDALARVASVHGAAGPFAVAGYRMGERAIAMLDLPRGSFDLEVIHETPPMVQWSCVADGLQAATATSAGKLNLKVLEISETRPTSTVRNRRTGKTLRFTLAEAFVARFKDLPQADLPKAGAEVMALSDEAIFQVTALP